MEKKVTIDVGPKPDPSVSKPNINKFHTMLSTVYCAEPNDI